MTETEWLTCAEPSPMMAQFRPKFTRGPELRSWFGHPSYGTLPRKWRCFLAACGRRIAPLLGDHQRRARLINFAEPFADQPPTEDARRTVIQWFAGERRSIQSVRLLWGLTAPLAAAAGELRNAAGYGARMTVPKPERDSAERAARNAEKAAQCALIRDILGNPFRPVAFEPSWRTDTVEALARGIYQGEAFDGMPVLADALEEAGCDDAEIIAHCREPGVHVRGCWVVDLILDMGDPLDWTGEQVASSIGVGELPAESDPETLSEALDEPIERPVPTVRGTVAGSGRALVQFGLLAIVAGIAAGIGFLWLGTAGAKYWATYVLAASVLGEVILRGITETT